MVIACALQIGYKQSAIILQHDELYEDFFMQQQDLLTRIGRLLALSVQNRDQITIQSILSAYEGVMFSMQLPIGLQVVIFDAPHQVVGLNAQQTPDETFYTSILQQPTSLSLSEQYTLPLMPDYTMLSYGLGIIDIDNRVLGILEAKVPEKLLQDFLATKYIDDIYSYSLYVVALYIFATIVLILMLWRMHAIHTLYQQDIMRMQKYIQIQEQYQNMHIYKTNINVMQVILDVYDTCKLQANSDGIDLEFVSRANAPVYNYCQQVELYNTLLNILRRIINQVGKGATIKVMVECSPEKIIFKFTDDGYYYALDSEWKDCLQLVTHKHTTYEGNIINYEVAREIKDNVIFMEQALETT